MRNCKLDTFKKAFIILIFTAMIIPGFSQDPLIKEFIERFPKLLT
jgi:hypothetical protein